MKNSSRDALYLLGTGTPTPTTARFGTASVLKVGDDHILFDCGPATTYKMVCAGLWPTCINHLFLTHHHFDHNADLPCFFLCRWDQTTGKESDLKVFGPAPTEQIVERLIGPEGAFVDDWKARVGAPVSQSVHANRGGSLPRPEPRVEVQDVGPGTVFEGGDWRVTAAMAHHVEPWLKSLAYRVDTKRGSILFAGDTGACAKVGKLAEGVDVFIANCWNHQSIMDGDGEAPGQTGTMDCANWAKDCGAKRLVLTHTGPGLCKPGSKEKAISDIGAVYGGEIIFGEEGMVLDLWQ